MKNKINIPALFLALLVCVASNGISVFEHICGTYHSRDFSFFKNITCDMEKSVTTGSHKESNGCCQHKHYFSKLSVEGFTAKLIQLKPIEKSLTTYYYTYNFTNVSRSIMENHFSGMPPPDNLYKIKALLQPSLQELQVYLC